MSSATSIFAYDHGLEKPLATDKDGPAQLLPPLVKALEEVVDGVGPMAEAEARVLSSAALTRIFSHLHLRDPNACLDELLEPVAEDHYEAAAAAVRRSSGGLAEEVPRLRLHSYVRRCCRSCSWW